MACSAIPPPPRTSLSGSHPAAAQDGPLILLGDPAAAGHGAFLLFGRAAAAGHGALFLLGDPAAAGHCAFLLLGRAAAAQATALSSCSVIPPPPSIEHLDRSAAASTS